MRTELQAAIQAAPLPTVANKRFYDVPLRRLDALQPGGCCMVSSCGGPVVTVLAQQLSPPVTRGTGNLCSSWSLLRFFEFNGSATAPGTDIRYGATSGKIGSSTGRSKYFDVSVPFDVGSVGPFAQFEQCPLGRFGAVLNPLNSNCVVFDVPVDQGAPSASTPQRLRASLDGVDIASLDAVVAGRKVAGFPSGHAIRCIQWHPVHSNILAVLLNPELENEEAACDSYSGTEKPPSPSRSATISSREDYYGDLGPNFRSSTPPSLLLVYDVSITCSTPLVIVPLDDTTGGTAVHFDFLPTAASLSIIHVLPNRFGQQRASGSGRLTDCNGGLALPETALQPPSRPSTSDLELRLLWLSDEGSLVVLYMESLGNGSAPVGGENSCCKSIASECEAKCGSGEPSSHCGCASSPVPRQVRQPLVMAGAPTGAASPTSARIDPIAAADAACSSAERQLLVAAPALSRDERLCWFTLLQVAPIAVAVVVVSSGELLVIACADDLMEPSVPLEGGYWILLERIALFAPGEGVPGDVMRLQPLRRSNSAAHTSALGAPTALLVTSPETAFVVEFPWIEQLAGRQPLDGAAPLQSTGWPRLATSWVESIFRVPGQSGWSLLCGASVLSEQKLLPSVALLQCTVLPAETLGSHEGGTPPGTGRVASSDDENPTVESAVVCGNWDICDNFVLHCLAPLRSSPQLAASVRSHISVLQLLWRLYSSRNLQLECGAVAAAETTDQNSEGVAKSQPSTLKIDLPWPRSPTDTSASWGGLQKADMRDDCSSAKRGASYLQHAVYATAKAFEDMVIRPGGEPLFGLAERINVKSNETPDPVEDALNKLELFDMHISGITRLHAGVLELQESIVEAELDAGVDEIDAVFNELQNNQQLLASRIERCFDAAAALGSQYTQVAAELNNQLRESRFRYLSSHCYELISLVVAQTAKILRAFSNQRSTTLPTGAPCSPRQLETTLSLSTRFGQ